MTLEMIDTRGGEETRTGESEFIRVVGLDRVPSGVWDVRETKDEMKISTEWERERDGMGEVKRNRGTFSKEHLEWFANVCF